MRLALSGWVVSALLLPVAAATGWAQDQGLAMTGTGPQIVRVRYVEGDVRVSRGKDAEKQTHAEWEKAVADLPIDAGYSLVTGAGRAEVEFEDTSVAYLAENSVLVFNDLHTENRIPQTELALLSGTMSVEVHPMAAGEVFEVRTPTDQMVVRYPMQVFLRIDSYLDGMSLTPMGTTALRSSSKSKYQTDGGQTVFFRHGQKITGEKPADQTAFADFDQWVLRHAIRRNEAMLDTMKQAGLRSPVPGLEQLQGQGHFYPCPPYGTCWEPTNGFAGQATEAEKAAIARQTVSVGALAQGGPNSVPNPTAYQNQGFGMAFDVFPCSPFGWDSMYQYDPSLGPMNPMLTSMYGFGMASPYEWAICHTGSWIQNPVGGGGGYAWVAGTSRHRIPPVHWVRIGHEVGYVPLHPKDVAGKLPLNLKNGVVHPTDKLGSKVEVLAYNGSAPVKVLAQAPREFLKETYVPLPRTEAPQAEAHTLQPSRAGSSAGGTPITFDHRTQSFMVSQQGLSGGAPPTSKQMEPIGGRGSDLQVHVGGVGSQMARGPSGSMGGTYSRGNVGSSASYGNGGGMGRASGASSSMSAPSGMSAPSSMSAPSGGGGSSASSSSGGGRR